MTPGTRTVVQCDDVQAVQQLPLVLMDPLHVHVEHGRGVDFHLVFLLQEGRELQLVFLGRRKDRDTPTPSPQGQGQGDMSVPHPATKQSKSSWRPSEDGGIGQGF